MSGLISSKGLVSVKPPAAPKTFTTSTDLDLSGESGSFVVFADTTSAPLTVTLPSGVGGQVAQVVDAGGAASTNIITITGAIDGATSTSIEANNGSREFTFGSEWESSGNFNNYFERNAATNTIKARNPDQVQADILAGDSGTVFNGGTGDFEQAETNVDQDAAGWGNGDILAADDSTDTVPTGNYTYPNTNGSINAYDGDTGTNDPVTAGSNSGSNPTVHEIDFGAGNEVRIQEWVTISSSGNSSHLDGDLSYSDDGVTWTVADTFTSHSNPNIENVKTFTPPTQARRHWRTRFWSAANCNIAEVKLREYTSASTNNTFQYRPFTSIGSTTVNPSTAVFRDKDNTPLTAGLNIEYSTDNGSTWSSSVNITTFQALSLITCTSFWFRFQLTGSTTLKSALVQSAASYSKMEAGGMKTYINGSIAHQIADDGAIISAAGNEVARLDADGLKFNGDTASANALGDYEEGTWTPRLGGSTGGDYTPAANNAGYYTKIGNKVFCYGTVHWSAVVTAYSGLLELQGLPFPSSNVNHSRGGGSTGCGDGITNSSSSYVGTKIMMDPHNRTAAWIVEIASNANGYSHTPTVASSGIMYGICFTYITDS